MHPYHSPQKFGQKKYALYTAKYGVSVCIVHLKINLSIHRRYLIHIYYKANGHKVASEFHFRVFRFSLPLHSRSLGLEAGALRYMNNRVVVQSVTKGQRRGMPPRILDVPVGLPL